MQFLVVGAVLFLAAKWVGEWREQVEQRIVVDAARVQRLTEMFRVQTGASPSQDELDRLVETFIRDEILYREALRLGLDKDDEIVRRRLAQKMEFLSSDLAPVPEPTEADLRAFHPRVASRFGRPAVATFSHVFFSADGRGDVDAELRATRALARLNEPPGGGRGGSIAIEGDRFALESAYSGLTEAETSRIFGRSDFTTAVFSASVGEWSGPVRSGYGWHLVRVRAREPAFVPTFEQVEAQTRQAWRDEYLRAANEGRLASARARYIIIRDVLETH